MAATPKPPVERAGPPQEIGRYNIIKVLGRGGMGEVFKAVDDENHRFVAIKILDTDAARDTEVFKRFEREARSAMSLDHPNIARMYGIETDGRNQPFIVMEYIEGKPLDEFAKSVELPFSLMLDFVIQVARGLEAAYRRGIIHRDIKPSNLLVTPGNQIKIIDFGLAKSMWDTSIVTMSGMVVGTPRYISPEQAMGKSVDHRSDIYSLGASFYELTTHQCPFDGDTAMAIMLKHINTALIPPYMINPRVPGDVNEIVCRMLAKDQPDRYQDYETLIRDLESAKIHRLSKEKRVSEEKTVLDAEAPTKMLDAAGPGMGSPSPYLKEGLVHIDFSNVPEQPRSGAKPWIWAVGAAIVITLGVAGFISTRGSEHREGSGFAKAVLGIFKPQTETKKKLTPEEVVSRDTDLVQLTNSRMEGTYLKILEYRRQHRETTLRIVDLRKAGVLSTEETQDGWGNDFFLSTSGDTTVLVAPGRDGKENTPDDFIFSLDGAQHKVPTPITLDDAIIQSK